MRLERWGLRDFHPGEGETVGAATAGHDDGDWLEISAPGDVHRALIAAGRIPDPFYDRNETACAWMEEREWWYRLRCDGPAAPAAPGERLRLVCHGLDTFATVWLNGQELGRHHNMFRPAVFEVTGRLRPGAPNVLAVRFDPPLGQIRGKTLSAWGRNPERTAMRKAQFGYGWDWGPRLPTIGIWRPVELRREREACLVGVDFATLHLDRRRERAAVAVRVEAERFVGAGPLVARVELAPPNGGAPITHDLPLDGAGADLDATAYLAVDEPGLWWTHDLGGPVRYDLRVTLARNGAELDGWQGKVGIRTLALDQAPDPAEPGTRFFRFVLNGVPVFARGADWVPCDSFVGAIPRRRYETLLRAARDANMTMLRVWGGGIYEHDAFYDLCDELGLLVWQDFMFACAMYPEDDPDFVAEVAAEARHQIRRLRSHPCLALWCGNNENQWLHERVYWDRAELPPYGALHYDEVLPRAVAELDGHTPYWPGSPYGGDDHNDRRQGNVHNWEVWHGNRPTNRRFGEQPERDFSPAGVSFLRYAEDLGRFVSEFGMHAAPVQETLRRAIPSDQLFHHSPAMDWHNKDDPKNKVDNLMLGVTGLPTTLDEYVDFSQIAQAEGLKFGVEHFRRRKPHCSGTLVWQLDDCWPGLSWSVVDYYGFGKAGYFYLKRAYAPVLASFKALPDGGVELWVTNDTLVPIAEMVTARLGTFGGEPIWEEACPVAVPANASQPVRRWNAAQLAATPDRYLAVRSPAGRFPANRHFFAPIKDLRRASVAPATAVSPVSDHELRVELAAPPDGYAYYVHLRVPDQATHFSDNYLDLDPGERRAIVVTNRERPLAPDSVSVGWR